MRHLLAPTVAALPARPRHGHRPRGRRDQPGPGRRRAAAGGPGRAGDAGPAVRPRARAPRRGRRGRLPPDSGLVARFFTNPVAVVLTLFAVLAVVGARAAFGSITGGALSPVPDEVASWWQLHVQTWHPLGVGHRCAGPGLRAALRLRRQPGRWARCRRLGVDAAGRPLRGVGCVAAADRGRPPGRRPGPAALAARVGCADLRPRAGDLRGLGRGSLRHRRGGRPAAVDGPRRHGLRRPRPGPALARRVAHRAPARPRCRVRARRVALRPAGHRGRARRRPPSSRRGCCASATAGARPWWRVAATPLLLAPWLVPLVTTGSADGPAARGRPAHRSTRSTFGGLLTGRLDDLGAPWWLGRPGRAAGPAGPAAARHAGAGAGLLAGRARGAAVVAGSGSSHLQLDRPPRPGRAWACSSSSSRGWPWSPPCWAPTPT